MLSTVISLVSCLEVGLGGSGPQDGVEVQLNKLQRWLKLIENVSIPSLACPLPLIFIAVCLWWTRNNNLLDNLAGSSNCDLESETNGCGCKLEHWGWTETCFKLDPTWSSIVAGNCFGQQCCQQLDILSIREQLLLATCKCETTYHTWGNFVVGNSCQQQSCFVYGLLSKLLWYYALCWPSMDEWKQSGTRPTCLFVCLSVCMSVCLFIFVLRWPMSTRTIRLTSCCLMGRY